MTTAQTTHANELTQYSLSDVLAVATAVTVTLLAVIVALSYLEVTLGVLLGAAAVTAADHIRASVQDVVSMVARTAGRDDVAIQTDTRSVRYDAD